MVDCHMHMVLDGDWWRSAMDRHRQRPDISWIRKQLEIYRDRGFTWLRDGGDRLGAGKTARELASEYGICYRTPLSPLHWTGHYGGFIGTGFEDLKEFQLLAEQNRREGADFIKVMISGLMDFDTCGKLTEEPLSPEQIRAIVHRVKDTGLSVMLHANGARTVEAAALAGADSVEHGAYGDEASLAAMAENGVVWVPTFSTVANLRGKGRHDEAAVEAICQSFRENLQRFAAMGGVIASGSDAGAWQVTHGCDTEDGLLAALGIDSTAGNQAIQAKF